MNARVRPRLAASTTALCLTLLSCSAGSTNDAGTAGGTTLPVPTLPTGPTDSGSDGSGGADPTTTTTPATTTTEVPQPDLEVVEHGFSVYEAWESNNVAVAGAVLTNRGDEAAGYVEVVFTFLDAAGKPVATDTDYVETIAAGTEANAGVDMVDLAGTVASLEVAVVSPDRDLWDGVMIPLTVESIEPSAYGDDLDIRGTAKNDTDGPLSGGSVTCVVRSGGKIVGSAIGYLDTLAPKSSIAWNASGPVQGDKVECTAGSST